MSDNEAAAVEPTVQAVALVDIDGDGTIDAVATLDENGEVVGITAVDEDGDLVEITVVEESTAAPAAE